PQFFFRVSRQHIINLRFVRKIEPWFDGGLALWLGEHDPQIKVARRRAQELRERLSL
ncbi:MAG: LytTR family DNA-binding domain-containing protein, partial [Chthoniobacterales bacterium]